jgi:hypothetical protein
MFAEIFGGEAVLTNGSLHDEGHRTERSPLFTAVTLHSPETVVPAARSVGLCYRVSGEHLKCLDNTQKNDLRGSTIQRFRCAVTLSLKSEPFLT